MDDELAAIDLAPLDELTTLQAELATLDERLRRMEERRGSVAPPVYARVRGDYEEQHANLEARAAPLRERARSEYGALRALLSRCEAEHTAVALDREEVEFRFALDEFDASEHRARLAAIEQVLGEKQALREQALALRQRFVTAFGSEEALEAAGGPPTATPPDAAIDTQQLPTLKPASAPQSPPSAGATQVMRALRGDQAAPARSDQTMILRTARLVPANSQAGTNSVTLALKPVLIGSGEECDARVAQASPRHAEIRVSMAGFTVTDLGGGIVVNGTATAQHLLRHEDRIDIGPACFTFHEA